MAFQEDARVGEAAEALASEAAHFAQEKFGVDLDFSDESIQRLEDVLCKLQARLAEAKPTDQQVLRLAKMFGSYVGEVLRRNHGAQWGIVTVAGQAAPGMRVDRGGTACWPWGHLQNRLASGAQDDVWHYYSALTQGGEQ